MSGTDSSSPDQVSRSQRKREADAVLTLARRLVELPEGLLAKLPLPEDLVKPLEHARRLRQHIARQRETRFLAKCLRRCGSLEAIQAALESVDHASGQAQARFHALECLRDRLVLEGDAAVDAFIAGHRQADRQKLRQLVRTAQTELAQQRPPAAARKLFRYLRDLGPDE